MVLHLKVLDRGRQRRRKRRTKRRMTRMMSRRMQMIGLSVTVCGCKHILGSGHTVKTADQRFWLKYSRHYAEFTCGIFMGISTWQMQRVAKEVTKRSNIDLNINISKTEIKGIIQQ